MIYKPLMKVIQEKSPTFPYRIDLHISVVFAVIRGRFPKLTLFGHELRSILSVAPFKCKYMISQLRIMSIHGRIPEVQRSVRLKVC